MNDRDKIPCVARRCAQIKHVLNLSKCTHSEHAIYFLLGLNQGWVEFCTDCNKVIQSSFTKNSIDDSIQHIIHLAECVHPDSQLHFILGINGDWIEFCAACNKVTDLG